jgi:hypothetical protein
MERSPVRSVRRRARALATRVRQDESGMALMEVVASAALLAVVAVGTLSAFDVAGSASGRSKARASAASIAQDDQERMRGLEVRTLLARGGETRTVKAGPATFTVKSTAETVTDSADEGCTTGSGGIDYLKITSSVTWPGMRTDAVVAESLMAPRPGSFGADEGGFTVQIVDRLGDPVQGIPVGLQGATSYNDTTDENGCAFFTYIPSGDYRVTFSQAGSVTPAGVTAVNDPVTVPEGAIGNKVVSYDAAAQLTVNFRTRSSTGTESATVGTDVVAAHPTIPAPGGLIFSSPTPVASISTPAQLFPFSSPYSVYAGSCVEAEPDRFGQDNPTVLLGRGASGTVSVLQPSLRVRVRYGSTPALVSGATVRFFHNTCGGKVYNAASLTDSNGAVPDQPLPFGNYDVCADYDPPSTTTRRVREVNVNNNTLNGTTVTIDLTSSSSGGSCPTTP